MLLEARGINKVFGGLKAVQNVDYIQDEHTIYSVIGPNGAGKTTFFNVMTGIYKADGGTLIFKGKNIEGRGPEQVNAADISSNFRNIHLFNQITLSERLM